MKKLHILVFCSILIVSCNNLNHKGEHETREGTIVTDDGNSNNGSDHSLNGDTLRSSDGSSKVANQIKSDDRSAKAAPSTAKENPGKAEQGVDENMKGQSSTHGRDPQAGQ